MKTLAIIAEYNPFHKGHAYHIAESKRITGADCVFILMSGSAVQRGDFALVDKWFRAETALLCGADLVCELPFTYAAQSAEYFASGAIKTLNHTGVCDFLSFGSENGSLKAIKSCAHILADESPLFKAALKNNLSSGVSFPKARALAIETLFDEKTAACMREPNNILGIEYLKALIKTNSAITPITLKRIGAGYHDHSNENNSCASAAAIRKSLKNPRGHDTIDFLTAQLPYDPSFLLKNLDQKNPYGQQAYLCAIRDRLMLTDIDSLRNYPYINEGLEFKLKKTLEASGTYNDIVAALISKRMPESRIRRILMNLVMGFTKENLNTFTKPDFTPYLRVLGFNKTGQNLLKDIRKKEGLPIITNTRPNSKRLNPEQKSLLTFDVRATDLMNLYLERTYHYHRDYTQNPVILI